MIARRREKTLSNMIQKEKLFNVACHKYSLNTPFFSSSRSGASASRFFSGAETSFVLPVRRKSVSTPSAAAIRGKLSMSG